MRGNPLDALRTCYCGVRIPRCDSCYPPLAKRCSVQRDHILVDIVSFDRMKLCRFAALLPSKSEMVMFKKKRKEKTVGGGGGGRKIIVSHFHCFSHSLVTFL